MYDFNDAGKQGMYDLIPKGTIVPAIFTIDPGGLGDGGWLTQSKSSSAEMIKAEFTVIEGPYAKNKWWQYLVVSGGKEDAQGQSIAGNISRQTLRAILESAKNIKPDDVSPEATTKRQISNWGDLNGLVFVAKMGIETDTTGQWGDKNKIQVVVTPDMKGYATPPAASGEFLAPPPAAAAASSQPAGAVPAWAQ